MAELLFWVVIFIGSLIVLVKSSDYFIKSAEKLGISLGIPAFIVGVTIVAVGTSLPELASSIFAVVKGSPEIVTANVIGSNITNIFLILGIGAILAGNIKLLRSLIRVDLPILIGASLLMAASIWDGVYTRYEAGLSLLLLVIYLSYTMSFQKKDEDIEIGKKIKRDINRKIRKRHLKKRKLYIRNVLLMVLSLVFLYLSANYIVDSIIALSDIFKIGKEIISLTAVAIGTSLPELAVTLSAIRSKKAEIVVGNIMGSTIFNSLGVMGVAGMVGKLVISNELIRFGLPMMVIAAVLYFFITQDREITKWEGGLLIVFYLFFIGKVIAGI
jgi:cation:H+ antiporter